MPPTVLGGPTFRGTDVVVPTPAPALPAAPRAPVPAVSRAPSQLAPSTMTSLLAGGGADAPHVPAALLAAAAAAIVWLWQRIASVVTWRSLRVLSLIERPG